MVKLTFEELENFVAEISLILISVALIILISVFPNPNTIELFKDILFITIGAIVGIVGGKQMNAKQIAAEEKAEDKVA